MLRASAFTVPSTCLRHSHVSEVTPPHTATAAQVTSSPADSLHSMIPLCQSKTLSCRFDQYERTRPTQNTAFLQSFLEMTILSPLLSRKWRALTGGGPRDYPQDIAVARTRQFLSQQHCSFSPLFSAIFTFLCKKVVYPKPI